MKRPHNATLEELHRYCDMLEKEYAQAALRARLLEEQLRLARQRRFGASSEKTHPDQVSMVFNEAEAAAEPEKAEEPQQETITYTRRKRRGQREAMLDNLPVDETIEYKLPEEEQVCHQCEGPLHEMSTQTRRELKFIPAQVKVVQHVRHVYACRACERDETSTPIVTAPMPAPPIPGGLASPSAIAYVMSQKYGEGLPLYRQEQALKRLGVPVSRQTMANWIVTGSTRWLEPVYAHMRKALLRRDILQADETPVQVLREPGRKAETKSFMWLFRTGRDGPPIALFDYQPTRAAEHPRRFLSGFSGYLHVDGYAGYESVPGVTLVGCWAHARRKFDEALKSLPSSARSGRRVVAQEGLEYCNRLFSIEASLKNASAAYRHEQRLLRSRPVLDGFKAWLDAEGPKALPKSALAKAITYCQNQWGKLVAFLEDGRLEISNNRSERSIKPFVIGRKNWLFANTPRGARASAVVYSIVETAKENGLRPFEYLTHLFERLPNVDLTDPAALDALLPWSETLPEACHAKARRKAQSPA